MSNVAENLIRCLDYTAGCTEPAAIAYLGSIAGKLMKLEETTMELTIDERTYKNAYGAGIPNSEGKTGTEWALFLGYLMATPEKQLAIFSELTLPVIKKAEILKNKNILNISIIKKDSLHLDLTCKSKDKTIQVFIKDFHTNLVFIKKNQVKIQHENSNSDKTEKKGGLPVFDKTCFNSEKWTNLMDEAYSNDKLKEKIEKGIEYNLNAAEYGTKYIKADMFDDVTLVSGAIFARMNGEPIPVMSVAGSGNKGLTCIIPVVKYAEKIGTNEEKTTKAAMLSALLTSLVTTKFGAVSSICGAQYGSGAGIIAGILYLKDKLNLFTGTYNNFISAIGGGFCDGAKGSCSMRGNAAVITAKSCITHAENGFLVSDKDGFLGHSFLDTLNNLSKYNPIIAKFERETIEILKNK